jgi:hypothetical protein
MLDRFVRAALGRFFRFLPGLAARCEFVLGQSA